MPAGGNRDALDALFPLVYEDLRRRARHVLRGERDGHTLSTTALVNETYLKLVDIRRIRIQDRQHFLALAAVAMRRILVTHARRHRAAKRGAGREPATIDTNLVIDEGAALAGNRAEEMLALDGALDQLGALNPRLSRTVELRFFGGLSLEETADVLGVAVSTVKLDWIKARAWLHRALHPA